jgi:hypothetical protein
MHLRIGAAILLTILVGCGGSNGPKLFKVSGKVTLDGKPLPDAQIWFLPILKANEQLRSAAATTDSAGYYSLYSSDRRGALPGTYKVTISTKRDEADDVPGTPETVPDVYNKNTKLQAEVGDKSITFDFNLDSKEGNLPEQPATSAQ